MRRVRRLVAVAIVLALFASVSLFLSAPSSDANVLQRFGIGRDKEQKESILAQVRAGAFTERCNAPVEGMTEEGPEAYDLVDTLAGAPPAARHDVSLVPADQADAQLTTILRRLVATQAPPAGVTATVDVQNTRDIDARQFDIGRILVTIGLLDAVRNNRPAEVTPGRITNELAFVIAHEYAHVLLCHYNRASAVSRNRSALRSASVLGAYAVTLTNSSMQRTSSGATLTTDEQAAQQDYVPVLAGLTLLRTINSSIVNPSWGKIQERDADMLAVELMIDSGFDPTHVSTLLATLHSADDSFRDEASQIMAAVPAKALAALALTMNQNGGAGEVNWRAIVRRIALDAAVRLFQAWRINRLRHFHDDPEDRAEDVASMVQFRTRGNAEEVSAFAAFEQGVNAQIGQAFVQAASTELTAPQLIAEAARLLAESNIEAGCSTAQQALSASRRRAPGALMVCGQCELKRNSVQAAQPHLDGVLRANLSTPEDFLQVSELWAAANERQRAERALTSGARRFGQNGFYVPRMQLAGRYREADAIKTIADECAANARNEETKTQCAAEARRLNQLLGVETPQAQSSNPLSGILSDGLFNRGKAKEKQKQ